MPLDGRVSTIAEQQGHFARALTLQERDIPPMLCAPNGGASRKRFGIYRNNVFSSLTRCIASRFPVVARLVGEEFFHAMVRLFIESNLPSSPALIEYGADFPGFLKTFEPARSLPYLSDVARLEWLIATAYHAADAVPVGASHLARLGAAALEASLELHPSAALLVSHHSIFSIWETNTHDESVRSVDASSSGETVLVVRPHFDVKVVSIDTPTYAFIAALSAGHGLELAAELGGELDHRFDVGAALHMLFASGAVTGVRAPTSLQPAEPESMRSMSCAS